MYAPLGGMRSGVGAGELSRGVDSRPSGIDDLVVFFGCSALAEYFDDGSHRSGTKSSRSCALSEILLGL